MRNKNFAKREIGYWRHHVIKTRDYAKSYIMCNVIVFNYALRIRLKNAHAQMVRATTGRVSNMKSRARVPLSFLTFYKLISFTVVSVH